MSPRPLSQVSGQLSCLLIMYCLLREYMFVHLVPKRTLGVVVFGYVPYNSSPDRFSVVERAPGGLRCPVVSTTPLGLLIITSRTREKIVYSISLVTFSFRKVDCTLLYDTFPFLLRLSSFVTRQCWSLVGRVLGVVWCRWSLVRRHEVRRAATRRMATKEGARVGIRMCILYGGGWRREQRAQRRFDCVEAASGRRMTAARRLI